jgi:hypothetical protein
LLGLDIFRSDQKNHQQRTRTARLSGIDTGTQEAARGASDLYRPELVKIRPLGKYIVDMTATMKVSCHSSWDLITKPAPDSTRIDAAGDEYQRTPDT